jgi:hypothetical protein
VTVDVNVGLVMLVDVDTLTQWLLIRSVSRAAMPTTEEDQSEATTTTAGDVFPFFLDCAFRFLCFVPHLNYLL